MPQGMMQGQVRARGLEQISLLGGWKTLEGNVFPSRSLFLETGSGSFPRPNRPHPQALGGFGLQLLPETCGYTSRKEAQLGKPQLASLPVSNLRVNHYPLKGAPSLGH